MIRELYCLFRDGPGKGPVVAIQDSFGKAYHRFHGLHEPGTILRFNFITRDGSDRALSDTGPSVLCVKILALVDHASIRSILKRAGKRLTPDRGHWYEVHAD